jgi:hypothetical protein
MVDYRLDGIPGQREHFYEQNYEDEEDNSLPKYW